MKNPNEGEVVINFLKYRWRTLMAALAGVAAGVLMSGRGLLPGASALIGWNTAALIFLIPTLAIILTDDHAKMRARAKREDENRAVLMSLVLASVIASFCAIVIALRDSKVGHGGLPPWLVALSACTLVMSWLVVQTLFTLHYTHRYFGDKDDNGEPDGGIQFPGDAPTTYRDFIYVAICVGATCQVADFGLTNTRFRNLVTVHAVITFFFNTMILALGINIIGNLMGQ